jgi:hypothetical protein
LKYIGLGNDFLNRTLIAQQLRERTNKWNYMKLQSFCTVNEMVTRLKRQLEEWEKNFARYISDKGLITRTYRDLKKLNSQRISSSINKWAND